MTKDYRALVVRKANDNQYTRAIEICRVDDLPIGDVLIRVHFSSINYKDCLYQRKDCEICFLTHA